MDKGKGPCQKPDNTRGCQSVPNVNILETKLVRTYQAGSEFFSSNEFRRSHYLVWKVRVKG